MLIISFSAYRKRKEYASAEYVGCACVRKTDNEMNACVKRFLNVLLFYVFVRFVLYNARNIFYCNIIGSYRWVATVTCDL